MTGRETQPLPPQPPARPARSRLRRFFLRHLPLAVAGAVLLLALAAVGAYFVASSPAFENLVRERLVARLEAATGGRVQIASFHWRLLALEADAGGIVIHGLEAPGEAPYARIERLRVQLSVLGFLSPLIRLRGLEIVRPELHLIVYPDGTTNQPHPRHPVHLTRSTFNRLFNLQASRLSVQQGVLDYDNRAASFDFQNRALPLDFAANDVSLRMSYLPAARGAPASYRIETGATDLTLSRGAPRSTVHAVHGRLQATIDFERNAAFLRSLRLTAHRRGSPDRALEITAELADFARPRWQATVAGALDMSLLDPVTGFPNAPQGVAYLHLDGAGQGGQFHVDGRVRVDGGAYIAPGVTATGVDLVAHVHADPEQLLITSAIARLHQGGQLQGEVALMHWLPPIPGAALLEPAAQPGPRPKRRRFSFRARRPPPTPPRPPPVFIPVSGKVTAQLKNLSLDTILDIVSQPPFQRLGLDALVNGPATATWTGGSVRTLAVTAALSLSPSGQPRPGEAPTSGTIDAAYTQRNGAVAIRTLDLRTPASHLQAYGELGAYPLTGPTSLTLDLQSRNLYEFDTVLRSLGFKRNGRTGVAALPVSLAGQAAFRGTGEAAFQGAWTGSLVRPRIAGRLQATQLAVEMLPPASGRTLQSRFVPFDSVDVAGSYAPARIAISRGLLRRGPTCILLSGSLSGRLSGSLSGRLDASPTRLSESPSSAAQGANSPPLEAAASGPPRTSPDPGFDSDFSTASVLHLRLQADKLSIAELQPFFPRKLPAQGTVDVRIQADGPLRALDGSGSLEMNGGSIGGEPVTRLSAQGSIANQLLKLTSVTASAAGGAISGTGSYDFRGRSFQAAVHGDGIDISRIDWLRRRAPSTTGNLAFEFSASGTTAHPQLQGRAELTALTVGGARLGGLELQAHTAGHVLNYQANARLEGAALNLHGQTTLSGDYPTQAQLDFSRFNIESLLDQARFSAFSGQSALAGSVTVQGPLAHPDRLQGQAILRELAVTLAGVHLQSQGGLRASLANGAIHLDPIHVTGENTDLRAQGSLALTGSRQIDLTASGAINMKLAQTLDPDLTASGTTTFQVQARGPLQNPGLSGLISFQNGSLSLGDLPNGLSQLHGTLVFNQNRLEVRSLTAMTGGGLLSVGGYLSYQHGIYANLTVTGKAIRIRYPQGISSLADATLSLEGTQSSLLLSGNVLITRFTASPDLDIAALAAKANTIPPITPPNAPSNHIRLDVHIRSAPQLSFQNAFAKLAGNVDLLVGGTLAAPSLLGQVSITEGSALIAGTQYELQSGQISFTNPVTIAPTIDLIATARVQDYDITLGLHGTPQNLAVTYRSDPPLPEADVIALLALGRTASQEQLYTQQQEQSLSSPNTNALLAGALNATVSSRVQKLFGPASVKVDPNYLGAFGNSTSRITVQEQLGRNVTLTYATDVNTTGQQLLQADVAINRHVSLVVARDESGVFSMVIKTTRRYR